MDKKGRMIRLFIFWGIVTLVCIISYSIYRYRIHLQNIRYMRNEDSIEFLYDGLRKYELQQATEAKLEYISADGSIFYFDNEQGEYFDWYFSRIIYSSIKVYISNIIFLWCKKI